MKKGSLAIRNMTTTRVPRVAFYLYKKKILGERYELSLAFLPPRAAQKLNKKYRRKSYTPNVLTFPLTRHAGEIVICPTIAKHDAKKWQESYAHTVLRLFIHGLLHLKGLSHGSMKSAERRLLKESEEIGMRK